MRIDVNCKSPLTIKYKDYGYVKVPCGQCICCRVNRSSLWSDRIKAEIQDGYKGALFVTLTYSDEYLPYAIQDDGSLVATLLPDDLTKFFKRFRSRLTYYKQDVKIKYFACGEYGDSFGRPHYHAIIIGLLNNQFISGLINDCWSKGLVDVQAPKDSQECINYVTGYIMKKYSGKLGQERYGSAYPPFQRSSLRLGYNYYKVHSDEIIFNQGLKVRGKVHPLPKSLLNKPEFDSLARLSKYKFFRENFMHPDLEKEERDFLKSQVRASQLNTFSSRR